MSEHADLRRIESLQAGGLHAQAAELAEERIGKGAGLPIHLRLVTSYLNLGRYRDAAVATRAAIGRKPSVPQDLLELGKRLMLFQFSGELLQLARQVLAKPQWSAGLEADLSIQASVAGEQDIAVRLLERAMKALGPAPIALYNRSQLHMYFGAADKAEADLRKCLKLEPGSGKAFWALSKLRTVALSEQELRTLDALSRQSTPGAQNEIFSCFALFNFHDRADRTQDAWAALARGCALKRSSIKYDRRQSRQMIESLVASPFWNRPLPAPPEAAPGLTPIFIVGMHRSGTTLLERMLGSHSLVQEAGELYDFPAQLRMAVGKHFNGASDISVLENAERIDFPEVGKAYSQNISWRSKGRPFVVDKLPSNFSNVGYIRHALPGAKVIHVRRDPMDTCFSNLKELFSSACPYSYEQSEMSEFYGLYASLMSHWQRVLPGFVLDVSYEDLTLDPETEGRRIMQFCKLPWEPQCLDISSRTGAVSTASSVQVREPIHRRNVLAWKRYAEHLEPLRAGLAGRGIAVS